LKILAREVLLDFLRFHGERLFAGKGKEGEGPLRGEGEPERNEKREV